MPVPTLQQQPYAVNTPFLPSIGPRTVPVVYDFSLSANYALDFSYQINQALMDKLQTAFIDNSQNSAAVTLAWSGSQQEIIIGGNSQGFVPLLVGAIPKGNLSSLGSGKTTVSYLNIPIAPAVWSVNGTPFTFNPSTGALIVSDPVIDSVTTSNGVQVIERVTGSGDAVRNFYKSQNVLTGAVQSSVASLLVGSPSFFVNFVDIYISGDASLGAQTVNGTSFSPARETGSVTLSNANLSVSCGTGNTPSGVGTSQTFSSGSLAKIYYEASITFTNSTEISNAGVGIANLSQPNNTHINQPFAVGMRYVDGAILVGGASSGTTGGAFLTTQNAAIAIDIGNKLFWAKNLTAGGNWNNNVSNNPATGVGGISFSGISGTTGWDLFAYIGSVNPPTGSTVTANFGSSAFSGTVPSGFVAPAVTTGGTQGVTVQVTDGTNVISEGYAYVGASLTGSTAGPSANVQMIKLDQLNYTSKTAANTLGLSILYGGSTGSLATGVVVYNIGAGVTSTLN